MKGDEYAVFDCRGQGKHVLERGIVWRRTALFVRLRAALLVRRRCLYSRPDLKPFPRRKAARMDIFEPCFTFQEAELIKAAGIYPFFHTLSSSEGPVVTVKGRQVIMLGSNNYLGLTHHPEVVKAAHQAIDKYGTSCTGSRLLNGNLDLHEQLERELAEFTHKEAAVVFSTGFLANMGSVGLLAKSADSVIFSEAENHASLIEGSRIARGAVCVYEDLDDLERKLSRRNSWENALVVTDAVFSMTGRVVDLRRLCDLRRRYGFRLYVDDAHGIGVLGPQGRGTAAAQGVEDEVDLIFGTFSKSFASLGGFVAGEARVIDYLKHKARTLVFSAALPPACAAAALAALGVMKRDEMLFQRLWDNVAYFREGLAQIGYYTMGSRTPILPLFVGSESLAFRVCREALDMGVFTTPVVNPAVPLGQALIRTSIMPAHERSHLDKALEVFASLAERYPIPMGLDGQRLPTADSMDFTYLHPDAVGG
jgi:8-amino-7-oxononanoate synthase